MNARIIAGRHPNLEKYERGLGEFFFESCEKYKNKTCQIDATTGQAETFESVKERSTRVAINLRDLGLKTEDVVLCCTRNTLNSVIPVLASLFLGSKVCSLDTSLSVSDCTYCVSIVRPTFVFVEGTSLQLIEESCSQNKINPTIIVLGESVMYRTFNELLKPTPKERLFRPTPVGNCNDTAIIFFSSGTTGLPKGIRTTPYGLLNSIHSYLAMDIIDHNVILFYSSLFWISSVLLITSTFMKGGCRVIASKFEPEEYFRIVQKYKVTMSFLVPAYTYPLVAVPNLDEFDTSSLRKLFIAGSPISPSQLKRVREVFKHTFVYTGYGSTEGMGILTSFDSTKDRHVLDRLESCGRCLDNVQIKVVDCETRQVLGPNTKGEICFKTPYMSPGFYNNSSRMSNDDGFIETGDLGYYDEDECLYVVERIKEMFKYRSWHVTPTLLDGILQEHPSVKEAAVFGLPNEIDEYWPAACVVLKEGVKASVEDIDEFYSRKVSDWHRLRGGIKVVTSIPKSPSGKLQRWKISKLFTDGGLE